jgi:hypothetical protein
MRDFADTASADAFLETLTQGGRGYGNVKTMIQRISMEGSERKIHSPLESTFKAIAVATNRAERNRVGQMMIKMTEEGKMDEVIKEMPIGTKATEKNCTFTVMFDGVKKVYQTTPELYHPIVGYNLPAFSMAFGIMKTTASVLRTGATMSPSFILRNLVKDTFFAGISSRYGFVPLLDTFRGAYELIKNSDKAVLFHTAGGDKFNFYADDAKVTQSLDELAGGKHWREMTPYEVLKTAIKGAVKYPVAFSNLIEASTRMGEFMKALEATGDIDVAVRASKEITLDFSRSGIKGQQWNQAIPFMNATIQGTDKLVRLFAENPLRTSAFVGAYIVAPTILLWLKNRDEKWYKELDRETKYTNWCISEDLRIPKPQEAGLLFGGSIEAGLDMAFAKDPKAMGAWAERALAGMIPSIIPTAFLPIVEWMTTYSLYQGKPSVGKRYQNLPDELQFTPYTSEASKAVGKTLGLSPIKIDNLVRGYTGTMGILMWQAMLDWKKDGMPEKKLGEHFVLRDFNVTEMNRSKDLNDFYDMLQEANEQHAGYGVKGKPSQVVKDIRKVGQAMSKLNKEILDITVHPKMDSERKRKLIDIRNQKRRELAKRANQKYGKFYN